MKTALKIILPILIVVLVFFLIKGINTPIQFEKVKKVRYQKVIQNLKDIRIAELAYKDVYGTFTGSFDTLIDFVKYDSMPLVRSLGSLPDTLNEQMALDMGIIVTSVPKDKTDDELLNEGFLIRDTVKISVLDSIFPTNYPIDSLRYIPYTNNEEFSLGAGIVETGSKVKVQVFEAGALNDIILHGLNKQLIINLNEGEEYPGLRVGSLKEATNNAGNWE
ncbi:MAG: hypothetical protein GXO79_13890 [Chlorobi bacterium]|nr:hypothetical protein [Chlorobiota bacterium]